MSRRWETPDPSGLRRPDDLLGAVNEVRIQPDRRPGIQPAGLVDAVGPFLDHRVAESAHLARSPPRLQRSHEAIDHPYGVLDHSRPPAGSRRSLRACGPREDERGKQQDDEESESRAEDWSDRLAEWPHVPLPRGGLLTSQAGQGELELSPRAKVKRTLATQALAHRLVGRDLGELVRLSHCRRRSKSLEDRSGPLQSWRGLVRSCEPDQTPALAEELERLLGHDAEALPATGRLSVAL
jgi:hypothetical protein